MLNLLQAEQNLFATFASSIRALPDLQDPRRSTKTDLLTTEFRLHRDEQLSVYYAPFDYVNHDAKVWLEKAMIDGMDTVLDSADGRHVPTEVEAHIVESWGGS